MGMTTRNFADAIVGPKVDRREMRALNAAGVFELLEAARGTEMEAPIAVAIGTGLRRGELLGLRWTDVDLEEARIHVRRSVETIDGVIRTKPPKTARSARTLTVPAFVVDVLRRAWTTQAQRRLNLGFGRSDDGWVFTRADESQWEPGTFSLHFARLVKAHKITHVRFHDLRHTFGTLALASGVDLKTVSAALGHSTIGMTANTYLHAVESLQRDAAARIDTMLGDAVSTALLAVNEGPGATTVPRSIRFVRKRPTNRPNNGSANGNRTRLSALKGRCPNR